MLPIFRSTVFELPPKPTGSYDDVRYPRLNNLPNHRVAGEKIAALEGAEAGLVMASGMAAVTTTLMDILQGGKHLLIQGDLYGGTRMFVTEQLERLGMRYDFIDAREPSSWEASLRPDTRAIYVETTANPLLQVADHAAVVAFARKHELVSLIDNTFATPINFRPIEHGFDLSIHSATKYLNGHSDLVAGAVAGSVARVDAVLHLLNLLGGSLDPEVCFLLNRGMKTLALRVERQNANGLALARCLESQPAVEKVYYPGLESHPDHTRARELFAGFGGMLSFDFKGGLEATERFMAKVELPVRGPSLGGVETLVTRPSTTSHAGIPPGERAELGITESLIRVSVGIEAAEDLIDDFTQALA